MKNERCTLFLLIRLFIVILLTSIGAIGYTQTCTIALTNVKVSSCYQNSGSSKATVSFEVDWTNAPAGDSIKVQIGTAIRYFKVGTFSVVYSQPDNIPYTGTQNIVSPQLIAFEVAADGSTHTINASFTNHSTCSVAKLFTSPASCAVTSCASVVNALGGIVFNDFNSDGVKDTGEIIGVSGVSVVATSINGTIYSTTTNVTGDYLLSIPLNQYPIRLEFKGLTGVNSSTFNGLNSSTSVQFISSPSCGVNFGVSNPSNYCGDSNLSVFIPCFVYGDPLVSGSTSANSDALVSFPYGLSSSTYLNINHLALASQVGTIWGSAYQKNVKKLFVSSVLKRHAGLGALGLGGIYTIDVSNNVSPFINVSTIGVNVGTIPSNSVRGLVGDKTLPSTDSLAFINSGKVGIGDLDISEDGNRLWFTNLNDHKLYSIDISQFIIDGITKPTAASVTSYSIPSSCTSGVFRPWAIKPHNGKIYVGGICDASVSNNKSDLRAMVYELSGSTFTEVFNFPLTYPKGYPNIYTSINRPGWFPWTDSFNLLKVNTSDLCYPQPMFSDIEFDIDGAMILALGDRTGMQGGDQNYRPSIAGGDTRLYSVNSIGGDILRAVQSGTNFILENNGKVSGVSGFGVNNNQGPGFGEFYNDNWNGDGVNRFVHAENVLGALALKPGSGNVIVTTIDPVDNIPFSGGVRYLSNMTGLLTGQYQVYHTRGANGTPMPGTFAKATGLGDIEISCDILSTLQLGNRLWLDSDRNGIQDPGEPSLPNVTVALWDSTGAKVAEVITDAIGTYYFDTLTIKGGFLLPNTSYKIVVNKAAIADTLLLTSTNVGTNDAIDSDAILIGNHYTISLRTGSYGENNHTYDIGFINPICIKPIVSLIANRATCMGSNILNNASLQLTSISNATRYIYGLSPTVFSYDSAIPLVGTSLTIGGISNPVSSTTYHVRLYNGVTCYTDQQVVVNATTCSLPCNGLNCLGINYTK